MKLINFFEILGLKRKTKHYGYAVEQCDVGNGIVLEYARWQHKKTKGALEITAAMVTDYQEILNEGDFCIDIGAHMGDSTLPMAVATGVSGCALALEPNPFVYHVLEKNARANRKVLNMETMMAGVAPENGFIEFEYSDPGYCNGGRHEDISALIHGHPYKLQAFCVNLDSELRSDYGDWLEKLKFIKVDTEGFDLYVLQSLRDIIEQHKPKIKAEVFKQTSVEYRKEMFNFFEGLGYDVFKIKREPIEAGEKLSKDTMGQRGDHYDIFCVPS